MDNKNTFSKILLISSFIFITTSIILYILIISEPKDSFQTLDVIGINSNNINVINTATANNVVSDINISFNKNAQINSNISTTSASSKFSENEFIVSDSTNFYQPVVSNDLFNQNLINPINKIITGSIYYTLYNSASLFYQYDKDVKINKCDCKSSNNFIDCNFCLKCDIFKDECNYPEYFGSSLVNDPNSNEFVNVKNGFICNGLNRNCNDQTQNPFNKNSLNWRTIIIYDNKPNVEINPYFMGLYLTHLYFIPINYYTPLLNPTKNTEFYNLPQYSSYIMNASNFYEFEDKDQIFKNGSSYFWGQQDIYNGSKIFYNEYPNYKKLNDYFIGPQNGCLNDCDSNCSFKNCNSKLELSDDNENQNYLCACNIPYYKLNNTRMGYPMNVSPSTSSELSMSRLLSIVKPLPSNPLNMNEYDYIFGGQNVDIYINHTYYKTTNTSNNINKFGAFTRNTHSSISSFKETNDYLSKSVNCGDGFSSIDPFNFGQVEIIIDYTKLKLTKIPYVDIRLQSSIKFQYQAGDGFSCFIKETTINFTKAIIRNFPSDNLKSTSCLNGFYITYKIFL